MRRILDGEAHYKHELAVIDGTSAAKEGDAEQLVLLVKDAEHARDVTRKELAKAEESANRERQAQCAALAERKLKLEVIDASNTLSIYLYCVSISIYMYLSYLCR